MKGSTISHSTSRPVKGEVVWIRGFTKLIKDCLLLGREFGGKFGGNGGKNANDFRLPGSKKKISITLLKLQTEALVNNFIFIQ